MEVDKRKMAQKKNRANKRICEGDRVVVIAGNDKGRTGVVLSRKDDRFIIQGVNIRKKHAKKTQEGPGKILNIEMPINASNVMLCPAEDKGVKLRARVSSDGMKELVYAEEGNDVLYRPANKKK